MSHQGRTVWAVQRDVGLVRGAAPLRAVGVTDTGRLRRHNEDAMAVLARWVVVADGLGGHRGGALASAAAVAAAQRALGGPPDQPVVIQEVIRRVQAAVVDAGRQAGIPEASTTIVVAGVVPGARSGVQPAQDTAELVVAHVGDSRAGLLRDGVLTWLTVDHNEAAELVASEAITAAEAFDHPGQHVLTRSLGAWGSAVPDVLRQPVPHGSRLLLCSDGLSGYVPDEVVSGLVSSPGASLEDVARALLDAAYANGAPDNITVVLADL